MIRSYTVSELEQMSGCTRRTISDYIAKGVLTGPSHRGRGAVYPQKDLDVLTVLPRIRTLMKKEYPTLKEVSAFLHELSVRDINRLATRVSEEAFVSEMRRLRVRNSLMNLLPYVPPERIESLLARFTPGQIRGIDSGRYQIGAVMDIEALLHEENMAHRASGQPPHAGSVFDRLTQRRQSMANAERASDPSWSANWLNRYEEATGPHAVVEPWQVDAASEEEFSDTTTDLESMRAETEETQRDLPLMKGPQTEGAEIKDRLAEIAQRLEKLESMLDKA